jgi:hypothetical protein
MAQALHSNRDQTKHRDDRRSTDLCNDSRRLRSNNRTKPDLSRTGGECHHQSLKTLRLPGHLSSSSRMPRKLQTTNLCDQLLHRLRQAPIHRVLERKHPQRLQRTRRLS